MVDRVSAEELRGALDRLLASSALARAERCAALCRFLVERLLAGDERPVKEYHLGLEVFDRPASYDPRTDPIVRVEMRQLRLKLAEYYAGPGAGDPIVIEFPKGQYLATARPRVNGAPAPARNAANDVDPLPPPSPTRFTSRLVHVLALVGLVTLAATAALLGWGDLGSAPPSDGREVGDAPATIAVLPFRIAGESGQEAVAARTLTDLLISHLWRVPGLRVLDGTIDGALQTIAAADQRGPNAADLFLEGSVQRGSGRVRVVVRLTRGADAAVLWADHYERQAADWLVVNGEISAAIVDAVRVHLESAGSDTTN